MKKSVAGHYFLCWEQLFSFKDYNIAHIQIDLCSLFCNSSFCLAAIDPSQLASEQFFLKHVFLYTNKQQINIKNAKYKCIDLPQMILQV